MEGRPRTNPEQDRVLAQGQSSGKCQRLKSDIYLSLSVWHSTSLTNFPRENLLREAFCQTILSFTVLILLNFTSSLSSTLSIWCGRNHIVHLSIGCPRYNLLPRYECTTIRKSIHKRNSSTAWITKRHYYRSRNPIHIGLMELNNKIIWN